jgi:hypothetical protein
MKLSRRSYEHAQELIADRRVVLDDRDAWSEHQPSAREENEFIAAHGWDAYGRWHLGLDESRPPHTKAHYKLPYGDFQDVHRCGILSAESRAAQRHYEDIARAVAHLHGMLELLREKSSHST